MKTLFIIFSITSLSTFSQCEKIEKTIDKFTDKVTWTTPLPDNYSSGQISPVQISKVYGKDTAYFMVLSCEGSTPAIGKGVYVLFYNGAKIVRENEAVDVSVNTLGEKYRYTAAIQLTKQDVKLLKSFTIQDFRLYLYDSTMGDERHLYKDLMKCLIAAK